MTNAAILSILAIVILIIIIIIFMIRHDDSHSRHDRDHSRSFSSRKPKQDPIVGSWTIKRSGGVPRDLTSEGTALFHADGTAIFNFANYLGVPTPGRPPILAAPAATKWKKIGERKYRIFAHTLVAFPSADPDHANLGEFPLGNTIRATCEGTILLNANGTSLQSIPGTDQCDYYSKDDLTLSTPVAPTNSGETYTGRKIME